ncbi:MAG: Trm112 family protein [Kofleriaceae bacterium]
MLPKELLDGLVCAKSKQPLIYFPRGDADTGEADGYLLCPASRLRYRIEHGFPVMLPEEAAELAPEVVERLIARARQLGLTVPPAVA